MCNLATCILNANQDEIQIILDAVLLRYDILFPDWEINTISLKKNQDRNAQIDEVIQLLQKMKTVT